MPDDGTRNSILLLGCNGQLGYELHEALRSLGPVTALDYPQVDFANPEGLFALVRREAPAVIVNSAAYTAVDKAESDEVKAHLINAEAPAVLAKAAAALGAIFVHYSTDYVFDGSKQTPYVETDTTNPLSVYGRTKRDGEVACAHCNRSLVFRTSWVIGAHGENFIKTMLHLAGKQKSLRVVADQCGAPTSTKLLAEVTTAVLRKMATVPAGDSRWGLYHLVASGQTTWHGLACRAITRAAAQGLNLTATADDVAKIPSVDYPTPAKRPPNSRLETSKLCRTFGISLPDWTEGVDAVVDLVVKEMRG